MSIEAMKMALAALETCRIRSVSEWSVEDVTPKNITSAIEALRTAIQQAEAKTDELVAFKRELRYYVVKTRDVEKYLTSSQIGALLSLLNLVALGRKLDRKPTLECVVVESDWPEYGQTWRAIEDRVSGRQQATHPAPGVPDGHVLVPISDLEDAEESIDDYRNGLEYGLSDTSILDRLGALITAAQAQKT